MIIVGMMMIHVMVQCSHTDVDEWMIQKMIQYSHMDTIEDGSKDEATDDDDPEDDSTFIC